MKTSFRWVFHLTNFMAGATGCVLAVMIYLIVPVDEWSIVNHPWQPLVQHLHVLSAPVMVFVVGVIWAGHVLPRLNSDSPSGKRSGLLMVPVLVVMTASGYLVQVAVEPSWRDFWKGLHVVVSFAWLAMFAVHLVVAVRYRKAAE